jgi:hypothetical protein
MMHVQDATRTPCGLINRPRNTTGQVPGSVVHGDAVPRVPRQPPSVRGRQGLSPRMGPLQHRYPGLLSNQPRK